MKGKWIITGLALFACALLLPFGLGAREAKKAPYKIGCIFAVTGPASSLGEPEKNTIEMLVDEINAKGGINGHPIKAIIYDTEGDETKALAKVKRLINNDQVLAIIGPTRSGTSLAIIDYVSKAQVPMISCAASWKIVRDPKTGKARKWIFKTPQSDSLAVEKIYEYLTKKGIKKVAIMTVSNGFGDSGREQLKKLAPKYGIKVVADERFGQDDIDMTAQLTRINGTDAQAVIVWAVQKAPAIVTKNMRQLGMKQLLVMSHGVASKKFIQLAGKDAEGIILPAGRLIVAEQLPDTDPQKKVLLDYKKKYEAKYGPVSTFGGHAYDALMMLVKALEKAGADRAKIRDELERIKGFIGTDGIYNMSPNDHEGLTKDAFVMVRIKNGDWELIKE